MKPADRFSSQRLDLHRRGALPGVHAARPDGVAVATTAVASTEYRRLRHDLEVFFGRIAKEYQRTG